MQYNKCADPYVTVLLRLRLLVVVVVSGEDCFVARLEVIFEDVLLPHLMGRINKMTGRHGRSKIATKA